MSALLISAFPGSGKSHFYRTYKDDIAVLDSDSSTFDKSEFPQNYIKHIQENKDEADIIFISSHKEVRDALQEADLDFTVVYPNMELKDEYIERYKERGNEEAFVELLDKNWESWITEIEEDESLDKIRLEEGEFMSDVLQDEEVLDFLFDETEEE